MKYYDDFEKFQLENEDALNEYWDEYKWYHYEGEYFHYDDVDWWNEDFFVDMSFKLWYDLKDKAKKEHDDGKIKIK